MGLPLVIGGLVALGGVGAFLFRKKALPPAVVQAAVNAPARGAPTGTAVQQAVAIVSPASQDQDSIQDNAAIAAQIVAQQAQQAAVPQNVVVGPAQDNFLDGSGLRGPNQPPPISVTTPDPTQSALDAAILAAQSMPGSSGLLGSAVALLTDDD